MNFINKINKYSSIFLMNIMNLENSSEIREPPRDFWSDFKVFLKKIPPITR